MRPTDHGPDTAKPPPRFAALFAAKPTPGVIALFFVALAILCALATGMGAAMQHLHHVAVQRP